VIATDHNIIIFLPWGVFLSVTWDGTHLLVVTQGQKYASNEPTKFYTVNELADRYSLDADAVQRLRTLKTGEHDDR
jgi:hypothetical protein